MRLISLVGAGRRAHLESEGVPHSVGCKCTELMSQVASLEPATARIISEHHHRVEEMQPVYQVQ